MLKQITAVDLKPVSIRNIHASHTGATSGYSYFNSTGVDIYVIHRNGISIKIDTVYSNRFSGEFVIRYNIHCDRDEYVSMPIDGVDRDNVKIFRDNFAASSEFKYVSKSSLHYDSVLSLDKLQDVGGVLYIRNLDILISLNKDVDTELHPFSNESSGKRFLKNIDKDEGYSTYSVRIVDNEGILSTQYIKTPSSIMSIEPVKDLSHKSGVYVIQNRKVKKANGFYENDISWSSIEEHRVDGRSRKEPLIFDKYHEAVNFKDKNDLERMRYETEINEFKRKEMAHREIELEYREKEREKENHIRKIDLEYKEKEMKFREKILELTDKRKEEDEKIEKIKRDHQLDMAIEKNRLIEKEVQIKRQQQELVSLEMKHKKELMKMKEEYEKKANSRKNLSEFIKLSPILVGGAMSIAGYVAGRKN